MGTDIKGGHRHNPGIRIEVEADTLRSRVGGGWVVGWSNMILYPTLALIRAQLGFRIEVEADRLIIRVGGWVVGWSNVILDPTLALIRAQLGFRIQVGAECGNKVIGPEEMPILVWGRRKRPPTKMGST